MGVQFEWQAATDRGEWETLAKTERRRWFRWIRRVPWWGWGILVAVILTVTTGGYVVVRRRYAEVRRQIRFQVQSVIDLEARAFAERDIALFLAQQDEASRDWYAQQEQRVQADCAQPPAHWIVPQERCFPALPAEVQNVELRGDVAWVEVIEGEASVRRVRFYRQTELGWKQTAPRIEFWKTPVELTYGDLVFRYHRRDEPHVDPLIELIFETATDVCATLHCPSLGDLEVIFSVDVPPGQAPAMKGDVLLLTSPWLAGLPRDGTWDEAYLQELTYYVAYGLASRAIRPAAGPSANLLEKAVLAEYAAWYVYGDVAQAPILGRIIERQGKDALPGVLYSLRNTRSLSTFLSNWLSLWPLGQETAFFETLLNIEREAIRLGYKNTFMLFQDSSESFLEQQETLFDFARMVDPSPSSVEVLAVKIDRYRARVTVKGLVVRLIGGTSTTADAVVFFRFYDGDWKHTSFPTLLLLGADPSPTWARTDAGFPGFVEKWLPVARYRVKADESPRQVGRQIVIRL